jgi:hypothetical protein
MKKLVICGKIVTILLPQKAKALINRAFTALLVAGAGFEPTTFGL